MLAAAFVVDSDRLFRLVLYNLSFMPFIQCRNGRGTYLVHLMLLLLLRMFAEEIQHSIGGAAVRWSFEKVERLLLRNYSMD